MSDRNPASGPADGTLLAAFRAGDASAFDQLVERHQASLLRFAASLVREATRAEDIVQEVFLRLLRKGPDLGSGDSAGSWLFRVCRNLAYDTMKMETREQVRRERLPAAESTAPDDVHEQEEVLELVGREWQMLPEREREALWLKVHEGLSYREIASLLDIKPGTVGWLIHEAMNHLTTRLRRAQAI
ncbi:MAG: RNA polymerase sigma factor [Planctomycetota bacterium]